LFKQLKTDFSNNKSIILNNLAIGEKEDILEFNEYSWDAMNSFLTRAYGPATITEKYDVNVINIDKYCKDNNI